jgi:hypothetical protein
MLAQMSSHLLNKQHSAHFATFQMNQPRLEVQRPRLGGPGTALGGSPAPKVLTRHCHGTVTALLRHCYGTTTAYLPWGPTHMGDTPS